MTAKPANPTNGQTFTDAAGQGWTYDGPDQTWLKDAPTVGGGGDTSTFAINGVTGIGNGVVTHTAGGTTTTVDLPAVVANTISNAEAAGVLTRAINGTPDATAAQISALDANDDVVVDIDGTGPVRVPVSALTGAAPDYSAIYDAGNQLLDLEFLAVGEMVRVYALSTNGNASMRSSTTFPTSTVVIGGGTVFASGDKVDAVFVRLAAGTGAAAFAAYATETKISNGGVDEHTEFNNAGVIAVEMTNYEMVSLDFFNGTGLVRVT